MQQEQDTTPERWLSVVDWGGVYDVSDMGRVRSLDRMVAHWRGGLRAIGGRILKPNVVGGYHQVSLCRNGTAHYRKVHRLVLLAFVGSPPPGHEGRHLDGDRADNRLACLMWGTKLENAQDKRRHGTMWRQHGELCPTSKLTWLKVAEIRSTADTISDTATARAYGVSRSNISMIRRGETWRVQP